MQHVLRRERQQFEQIRGAFAKGIALDSLAVERYLECSEKRDVERDGIEYSE
jgi:hypothetical protein